MFVKNPTFKCWINKIPRTLTITTHDEWLEPKIQENGFRTEIFVGAKMIKERNTAILC